MTEFQKHRLSMWSRWLEELPLVMTREQDMDPSVEGSYANILARHDKREDCNWRRTRGKPKKHNYGWGVSGTWIGF